MRGAEELDAMHDAIVKRFPRGLTGEQFTMVTLESADEDGRVYPHSIADWCLQQSLLMGMFMKDGLIAPGWRGYHEPMWWKITDKGREWLRAHDKSEPLPSPSASSGRV
jgi:hypothetical protein